MGLFRFLFKWSLQITGLSLVGYHYALKPNQQADIYGIYRAASNSYRAAKQIYQATNEYKQLLTLKQNQQQYNKRLNQINKHTAQRIYTLSRTNQGVYMRLGQYIGHLKYAFPQQFISILSKLNQSANYQQRDYKYLKTHIQFALNKKTKQIFQSLNTIPIHTDLFYQIYKGQLLQNFLDINLKVLNPYAKSQSKYDFIFIKKAIQYINNFKNKNYPQAEPLLLQILYENLNKNVQKQLNLKLQEQNALKLKQTIQKIKLQNSTKLNTKNIPIYIPHIYQKYSHENILIEQASQGYRFNNNNIQTIKKQKYPIKSVAADLTNYWNLMIQKNILLLNYTPFNLMIRKSRPNQQGSYQISPMNFEQTQISQIFKQPYNILFKQLINNKKLNIKNPQQRINSIKQFYYNLPKVFFNELLNYQNCLNQLKSKVGLQNITQSNLKQIQLLSRQQINKQTSQKLIEKKLLIAPLKKKQIISEQAKKQYNLLKKAFQIQYQPWNWQIMFNTYRQIFKQQQYFGAL